MVMGLYLPLVQDQAAASPTSPAAVPTASGQDAVGDPFQVIAIGDFQSQFGCGEGDTGCSATSLGESGGIWSAMFPIAPGSYSVQFAVTTQSGQYDFGSGGEGGSPISFTVNDGQAGAWMAWNALTNEADASGVDA